MPPSCRSSLDRRTALVGCGDLADAYAQMACGEGKLDEVYKIQSPKCLVLFVHDDVARWVEMSYRNTHNHSYKILEAELQRVLGHIRQKVEEVDPVWLLIIANMLRAVADELEAMAVGDTLMSKKLVCCENCGRKFRRGKLKRFYDLEGYEDSVYVVYVGLCPFCEDEVERRVLRKASEFDELQRLCEPL